MWHTLSDLEKLTDKEEEAHAAKHGAKASSDGLGLLISAEESK